MSEDEAGEVMVERDLVAPIEKIWRALTIPELVAGWLLPLAQGTAEPGTLGLDGAAGGLGGTVALSVVDVEPRTRIRYSWAERDEPETLVTFDVWPLPDGRARLRATHTRQAQALPRAANTNTPIACAA